MYSHMYVYACDTSSAEIFLQQGCIFLTAAPIARFLFSTNINSAVLNYHPIGHILHIYLVNQLYWWHSRVGLRIITPNPRLDQIRSDPAVGHNQQLYGREEPWWKRLGDSGGGHHMFSCWVKQGLVTFQSAYKWLIIFVQRGGKNHVK